MRKKAAAKKRAEKARLQSPSENTGVYPGNLPVDWPRIGPLEEVPRRSLGTDFDYEMDKAEAQVELALGLVVSSPDRFQETIEKVASFPWDDRERTHVGLFTCAVVLHRAAEALLLALWAPDTRSPRDVFEDTTWVGRYLSIAERQLPTNHAKMASWALTLTTDEYQFSPEGEVTLQKLSYGAKYHPYDPSTPPKYLDIVPGMKEHVDFPASALALTGDDYVASVRLMLEVILWMRNLAAATVSGSGMLNPLL